MGDEVVVGVKVLVGVSVGVSCGVELGIGDWVKVGVNVNVIVGVGACSVRAAEAAVLWEEAWVFSITLVWVCL